MAVKSRNPRWPTTRWSLVKRAGVDIDGPAMQELLHHYRTGMRQHLISARGLPAHDADDVLQGFLLNKMLRTSWLKQAQSSRGRFRNYLLTALDRYMVSELRKAQAGKRAPKSLTHYDGSDEQEHLALGGATPNAAALLDLAWIRERIDEALVRTRDACRDAERDAYWILFEDRVVNPILCGSTPQPYAAFVAKLGFKSPLQASNALTTVKRILARTFRDVVAEHTQAGSDVVQELRELRKILETFDTLTGGYE